MNNLNESRRSVIDNPRNKFGKRQVSEPDEPEKINWSYDFVPNVQPERIENVGTRDEYGVQPMDMDDDYSVGYDDNDDDNDNDDDENDDDKNTGRPGLFFNNMTENRFVSADKDPSNKFGLDLADLEDLYGGPIDISNSQREIYDVPIVNPNVVKSEDMWLKTDTHNIGLNEMTRSTRDVGVFPLINESQPLEMSRKRKSIDDYQTIGESFKESRRNVVTGLREEDVTRMGPKIDNPVDFRKEQAKRFNENSNLLNAGCVNVFEKQGKQWVYDPLSKTNAIVAGNPSYWLISQEGSKHCFNLATLLTYINKVDRDPVSQIVEFSTGEGPIIQNFTIDRAQINNMKQKLEEETY